MRKTLYLAPLTALLLAGCGKSEEVPLVLAGSFQATTTINAADIVMYTSAGRIDNPALVDEFLARRKNLADIFSRVEVPLPADFSLTLAFRSNNRATYLFKNATRTDSIAMEVISRSNQRLVLASLDSISGLVSAASNRAEQLSDLIPAEQAGKRCKHIFAGSSQLSQLCITRQIYLVTIHNGKAFIPQLSWIIQTNDRGSIRARAEGGVQNTFNPAFLNQLNASDTLVVQAREILLLKK